MCHDSSTHRGWVRVYMCRDSSRHRRWVRVYVCHDTTHRRWVRVNMCHDSSTHRGCDFHVYMCHASFTYRGWLFHVYLCHDSSTYRGWTPWMSFSRTHVPWMMHEWSSVGVSRSTYQWMSHDSWLVHHSCTPFMTHGSFMYTSVYKWCIIHVYKSDWYTTCIHDSCIHDASLVYMNDASLVYMNDAYKCHDSCAMTHIQVPWLMIHDSCIIHAYNLHDIHTPMQQRTLHMQRLYTTMGWFWSVGSKKNDVSFVKFVKEPYKRDNFLQKRPKI